MMFGDHFFQSVSNKCNGEGRMEREEEMMIGSTVAIWFRFVLLLGSESVRELFLS